MNTNKAKANGNVCLFFLKSFRNGQWSVSGRVRDLTEKSCFVRAGVAVFLIGYKKDVLQGEVYPLSQEEEVNSFHNKCSRGGLAGPGFEPAVASIGCNLLVQSFTKFLILFFHQVLAWRIGWLPGDHVQPGI